MSFVVEFKGQNAQEWSAQMRGGRVCLEKNKGKCLGQSIDWLKFSADYGRVPRNKNEYETCTKCPMTRVQFTHQQYSLLRKMGATDNEALEEIVGHSNNRSLEWLKVSRTRKAKWYTHRKAKFLNTAAEVGAHGGGGYLLLSATHAMAVWVDRNRAVFFDPNLGQMKPVPVNRFPDDYAQVVTDTYTKGSAFFTESRFIKLCA